jgi:hypothetical protein
LQIGPILSVGCDSSGVVGIAVGENRVVWEDFPLPRELMVETMKGKEK